MKVLNELTKKRSLPLDRIMPVTAIAIDWLEDKTVMVRRYAMQVSLFFEREPFRYYCFGTQIPVYFI